MAGKEGRSPVAAFFLQDDEFWRDVYKNVLTFSLTGLLALLVAVLGGYVTRPDVRLTAFLIAAAIAVLAFLIAVAVIEVKVKKSDGKHSPALIQTVVIANVFLILGIGFMFLDWIIGSIVD